MACATGYTAQFIIYVTDPVVAASFNAQYPNGVIGIAPSTLALAYDAPIGGQSPGGALTYPATVWFADDALGAIYAAHVNDPLFTVTDADFGHPNTYPGNCAIFNWVGVMFLVGETPAPGDPPTLLGQRNWVDGFEILGLGEGATSLFNAIGRDASRTVDGMGLAYRAWVAGTLRIHSMPVNLATSWERLYIRPRALANDSVWSVKASIEAGAAVVARFVGGALTFSNKGNGAYPGTLLGATPALTVGTWYRIDIRIHFRTSAPITSGQLTVYVNGVLAFNNTISPGSLGAGLDVVQLHVQSAIGADANQGASSGLECDFDDWNNAQEPAPNTPGNDLASGSHMQLVRATGLVSAPNWTGDWRYMLGNPQYGSAVVMTTTVAGAQMVLTTDYVDLQMGCAALAIGAFPTTAPTSYNLGYGIGGVNTQIAVGGSNNIWNSVLYSVPNNTDILAIPPLAPLTLLLQNGVGSVGTFGFRGLLASAEIIGFFGHEDEPTMLWPPWVGIHNAPFPEVVGAQGLPGPTGGVEVLAGTYIGNSLAQDILTAFPCHWWWVRSVGAGTDGVTWWSSMTTAHPWVGKGTLPDFQPRAQMVGSGVNVTGAATMRVSGIDTRANLSPTVYQFVGISDNAMRFLLNGAFSHLAALASANNALINPGFTPDGLFLMLEDLTGSGTVGQFFKGPGHTTDRASPVNGADVANIATFAAGLIVSKPGIQTNAPQTAYMAVRKSDGVYSGVVDVVTWTGNGVNPRTIAVNTGGRFPAFALVAPHNAASIVRDPSHTTNTSTRIGTGTITDGITDFQINQVVVGASGNANGIVYDMFVVAGGPTAGNPTDPPLYPPIVPWVPVGPPFPNPPDPPPPIDDGCISLGQAINELATRLGDTAGVHWTAAELQVYLTEALRVFNSLTHYYKGRQTFLAVNGQAFYELPTVIPTLRGYNVLDTTILTALEYALLEPPTPSGWTGTAMFTLSSLLQAMQRRLDRFRWETGIVVNETTSTPTPDAAGRIPLPANVITVRRLAWNNGVSTTPILRDDEWSMNAYKANWFTPVVSNTYVPLSYSTGVTPPLVIQLAPPTTAIGTFSTLSVVRGPILDAQGTLLQIPDDFTWAIKYGALADLLKAPGPANDPVRGQIADLLWQQAVAAAQRSGVVLDGRINNAIARVNAVNDADAYLRQWQTGTGAPTQILLAGDNLVALSPVPDALLPYTVLLDVVRNIPIPTSLAECYFEGGAALTQILLDYAQFVAMYKEGPSQAQEATQLLQRFLTACGVVIDIDQALEPDRDSQLGQTRQAERVMPRTQPAVDTTT